MCLIKIKTKRARTDPKQVMDPNLEGKDPENYGSDQTRMDPKTQQKNTSCTVKFSFNNLQL